MSLSPALVASASPAPFPLRAGIVLAAVAPIATGAILAARCGAVSPIFVTPAVALGVAAITSPALYIALAATGDAPPLASVARSIAVALAAFGIALSGLVLPAAFLALSAISGVTAVAVVSAALGGAAILGVWRLGKELGVQGPTSKLVLAVWALATIGVAGRLWMDLAQEVLA